MDRQKPKQRLRTLWCEPEAWAAAARAAYGKRPQRQRVVQSGYFAEVRPDPEVRRLKMILKGL